MAVYTEGSVCWLAGIHRNSSLWYQGFHSGLSAAAAEYQTEPLWFRLCTGKRDMFFSVCPSYECCFVLFAGLLVGARGYDFCLISVVLRVWQLWTVRVLFKLIVADRKQILLGDFLPTQSCIVSDGFGAGLGQSDRDREEERKVMLLNIYLSRRVYRRCRLETDKRIKCMQDMKRMLEWLWMNTVYYEHIIIGLYSSVVITKQHIFAFS